MALSEVDCYFEPWSGQTKDYKIGFSCFYAKHAALKSMFGFLQCTKSKFCISQIHLVHINDNFNFWSDWYLKALLSISKIICLKKCTYLICFINLSKSICSVSITVLVGMPTIKTFQFLLLHLVHIFLNLGLY